MRSLKSGLITWPLPAIPMRIRSPRHVSCGHWANRPSASNFCSISLPIKRPAIDRPTWDIDDVRRHANRTSPIVNREDRVSRRTSESPPRQPINGMRQPPISDKSRRFRSDDRSTLEPRVFPECSPQLVSGLLPDRSFLREFFVVRDMPPPPHPSFWRRRKRVNIPPHADVTFMTTLFVEVDFLDRGNCRKWAVRCTYALWRRKS